jgi:hypothetical protein
MVFNVLIVAVSLLLLLYWFRYTCLLLLHTQPPRDYSKQVAAANQLNVFDVRASLAAGAGAQTFDDLEQMLDRDYRLVMYLIRHAANFRTAGSELEQRMLMLDFHIMRALYRVSRRFSPSQTRQSLEEMAQIIAHFAHVMGERAAVATAHG